ncbi:MAG: hypothetical protein PVS3B1_21510 [Ktedonobacteraceae bacterium]
MADINTAEDTAKNVQDQYFRVTDQVPEEVWYWAALVSILASAILFVSNKRDWSIFVGQWPPTFLLFGLFHKLLRPSR